MVVMGFSHATKFLFETESTVTEQMEGGSIPDALKANGAEDAKHPFAVVPTTW
jgi:hypothetical protein